jgi:hypothetical protein
MRTNKKLWIVISVMMTLSLPAAAQEKVYWDVASKIRAEGIQHSKLTEYAWYLSDVIGPRLTGSPNMREAQRWLKEKMDEIGLENTSIESWGEEFASWDIEHISIHMTEPDYQMIIGYPLALTPGTEGEVSADAVIAVIEKKEDLEKHRGSLRGKIILTSPMREFSPRFTADAVRHDVESLSAYETQGIDINIAKRRQETWNRGDPRPEGINDWELAAFFKEEGASVLLRAGRGGDGTVAVTGRPGSRNDRSLRGIENSLPILSIAAEHYNRIYRILEHGIPVKLEIDVRIGLGEETEGANVIGEIRGTDLSEEVVMLGAHLDSWHAGTGASDNASGVAVVLEAMRILKAIGAAPRRSIRVGLWSAEEGGLKGSRGYVRRHFGNPRDGKMPGYGGFSVYFNTDNGTGRFRGVHLQENRPASPIFEAWMKPFHDWKMKTLSLFSNRGTDHMAFDEAGLPGFQFLQDRIDYRTRTWHFNMDHYDHIVPEDLRINAVIMASFAYHAAMRDERFPRKPFTAWNPRLEMIQGETFKDGGTLTNAIADFDNDGDLDVFIGFRGQPNRMYRNDDGKFTDVAGEVGLADTHVTRTSAWGDYDGDGHLDLFVGYVGASESVCRLYHNEGNGSHFTDVSGDVGVDLSGAFRQANFIDYDRDGDVDLYIGLRDKPNVLYRNDDGKFADVAAQLGVDDARRTVGTVWFDFDKDGDLDLYVANMDGDSNGLYRNDGDRFADVAAEFDIASGGRPLGKRSFGSVRPCLGDFDNDGNLDIFVANYGPNALYQNRGGGRFINVAPKMGLAIDSCYDTGTWGDYDNDGRLDLYVNGTITRGKSFRDYLFHNDGDVFSDITPSRLVNLNADHGAHWFDYDQDGDLDLSLTGASPEGMHYLLQNGQPRSSGRKSLQVMILDEKGHHTRAGTEIRLYRAGANVLLGTRIVDTGSGYNSQNAVPVHFGLGGENLVDVEITSMSREGRKQSRMDGVDPQAFTGRILTIWIDGGGRIVN